MRFDDRALHAQQRRAADFGGIKAALDPAERVLRQQRGQLALGRIHQAALNQAEDHGDHALGVLEQHVADKAIRRDDVRLARQRIARLDIADKVERLRLFHQRVGRLCLLVALGRLHADVQQADLRVAHVHHAAHVGAAHHRELHDPLRLAIRVRARVHQQHRAPRHGQKRRQRGAVNAFDAADFEHRARHQRARRTGGDKRLRLLAADDVHADDEGGIFLAAQRHDGVLLGGDDLRRVHHRQALAHPAQRLRVAIGRNRLLHQRLRADEDDVHIRVFAQRVDSAVHVDLGGEIAAHRVYDNFHVFFSFIFS